MLLSTVLLSSKYVLFKGNVEFANRNCVRYAYVAAWITSKESGALVPASLYNLVHREAWSKRLTATGSLLA